MTGACCVYTIMVGGYEQLNTFAIPNSAGVRQICLTDDPVLTSDVWEIRQVKPWFPMDPIRSQRAMKVLPHVFLPEFDRSLYIDNTIQLTADITDIFAAFDGSDGIALPSHSFRESVLDEFLEVARLGFDDSNRIFEQLNHYLLEDEAHLAGRPYWTAILLRDHRNPAILNLMHIWWAHIARYSRRDQLSFNYALRQAGVSPNVIDIDNFASWFHTWPHPTERKQFAGMRNPQASLRPVVAQNRVLEQDVAALRRQASLAREQVAALEVQAVSLQDQAAGLEAQLGGASSRIASLEGDRGDAIARLHLEAHALEQEKRLRADDAFEARQAGDALQTALAAAEQRHAEQAARLGFVGPGRIAVDGVVHVREGTVAANVSGTLSALAVRYPKLAGLARRVLRTL